MCTNYNLGMPEIHGAGMKFYGPNYTKQMHFYACFEKVQ
jgi:hypothetical protein